MIDFADPPGCSVISQSMKHTLLITIIDKKPSILISGPLHLLTYIYAPIKLLQP